MFLVFLIIPLNALQLMGPAKNVYDQNWLRKNH